MKKVTALVLTGGEGTRLKPVLNSHQKTIVKINGKPFLSYILDKIDFVGIKNVILCTGYKANSVEKLYGGSYNKLNITY